MTTRRVWLAALLCSITLLLVYAVTLPPSLVRLHYGADGGDLLTAVAHGGIPHPPGFPTYLLLGSAFIRLPWGEPAWRLGLMSAVLAAAAGGLTTAAVCSLLQRRARHGAASQEAAPVADGSLQTAAATAAAATAGLCVGLAPLLWSQALIVEVYAPAAFFAALLVYLVCRPGPAWWVGLVWGLGLGTHPILLFMAPWVAWSAWEPREGRRRRLAQTGLSALLGVAMLYGPALLLRRQGPSPWGDLSTLAGWWALVSGRLYHGYLLALPAGEWPGRLLAGAALMARQFTPLGAVLAALGWRELRREDRRLGWASLMSVAGGALYAMGYPTADSLVYLAPLLPLAGLWLGAGLSSVAPWLGRRRQWGIAALLLLPLLQVVVYGGQTSLQGNRSEIVWANGVLQQAPARAVLLTARDADTFSLWYFHGVLGERPDVVIVDRDLWGQTAYQRLVLQELGLEEPAGILSPEEAAQQVGRPVMVVGEPLAGGP